MRRTVPPSAEIEAQIDQLLAVGVGENPRESLSELAMATRCTASVKVCRHILGLGRAKRPLEPAAQPPQQTRRRRDHRDRPRTRRRLLGDRQHALTRNIRLARRGVHSPADPQRRPDTASTAGSRSTHILRSATPACSSTTAGSAPTSSWSNTTLAWTRKPAGR